MAGQPKRKADLVVLRAEGRDKVEELLSVGRPLEDICKELKVSRKALYDWLDEPEQAGLYTRARARAAHALADQALMISDEADVAEVARAKLRVDTRKWLASKWNAAQYGEQRGVQVNVNVGDMHLTAVKQRVIDVTPVHEADNDVIDGGA